MTAAPQHTFAEMGRFWNHPEVAALRKVARENDATWSPSQRKAGLNAIRDKVAQLKAEA